MASYRPESKVIDNNFNAQRFDRIAYIGSYSVFLVLYNVTTQGLTERIQFILIRTLDDEEL